MDLGAAARLAKRALVRNKMRSALTILGIVIGMGAAICTLAIGESASRQVQEQISHLGDNLIFIAAGSVNRGGVRMGCSATKALTTDDARAIEQ